MTDPEHHSSRSPSNLGPLGQQPPIWLRPWFQVMLGTLVVFLLLSFILPPVFRLIYQVRSVLTPVVFALVLAYIFNPLVTWADKKLRIPRWAGTGIIMAGATLVVLIALVVAVPLLIEQSSQLILKLQDAYPKVVSSMMDGDTTLGDTAKAAQQDTDQPTPPTDTVPLAPSTEQNIEQVVDQLAGDESSSFEQLIASEPVQALIRKAMAYVAELDWATIAQGMLKTLDIGTGVVGSAFSFTTYMLVFIMVAAFSFFFLSWHLGAFMAWFIPFIPAHHRDRTLEILGKMDRAVSAWLRGRLTQALLLSIMLTVGWALAGVPYWFLLGVISGFLGLVPYLIVIGWGIALLLATLDAMSSGAFSWWILVWPTVVYVIAQTIDGWVVEPLLQGKATEMGVLTVLLVVMLGGALGGLIGLLAAIPVAACVKILMTELVLPKLRALAADA